MAGRVDEAELTAREVEGLAVIGGDDARLWYRLERAKVSGKGVLAVDCGRASGEFGWIDEVRRALGVGHQGRVRASGHERAGAAGMVQMHMGGDHIVHVLRC